MSISPVAHFCILDHVFYAPLQEGSTTHNFRFLVYTKHTLLLHSVLEENSLVHGSSKRRIV